VYNFPMVSFKSISGVLAAAAIAIGVIVGITGSSSAQGLPPSATKVDIDSARAVNADFYRKIVNDTYAAEEEFFANAFAKAMGINPSILEGSVITISSPTHYNLRIPAKLRPDTKALFIDKLGATQIIDANAADTLTSVIAPYGKINMAGLKANYDQLIWQKEQVRQEKAAAYGNFRKSFATTDVELEKWGSNADLLENSIATTYGIKAQGIIGTVEAFTKYSFQLSFGNLEADRQAAGKIPGAKLLEKGGVIIPYASIDVRQVKAVGDKLAANYAATLRKYAGKDLQKPEIYPKGALQDAVKALPEGFKVVATTNPYMQPRIIIKGRIPQQGSSIFDAETGEFMGAGKSARC
jgi:hypothetical protein